MKTEIIHNEQIHMGVYVTIPQSSKSVKFVPFKTPTKRQTIIYFNQGFIESISTKTYTNHQIINMSHTVDGQTPAPVEVGSLSQYLQGFIHPPRWLFGISSINSIYQEKGDFSRLSWFTRGYTFEL